MCALEEVSREGKGRARGRIDLENITCQLGTLVGWTEAGDAPIQGLPAPKRESWCQDPSSVPCLPTCSGARLSGTGVCWIAGHTRSDCASAISLPIYTALVLCL